MNYTFPFEINRGRVPSGNVDQEILSRLGELFTKPNGEVYRLVRFDPAGTPASVARQTMRRLAEDGTWVVTPGSATSQRILGVVPADFYGADTTTAGNLAAGEVFFIQVSGVCEVISAGAIVAGRELGSGASGRATDLGADPAEGDEHLAFAFAQEAAAGAAENVTAQLKGLI